ncbi:hypothetical protein ACQ4M3_10225 [Leptolyngbya sp. AN03gr2]|uniref:hypothetical protein n=1 Tax=unclassified Leptolyngbya TaxID=2650499 RepID=UPI003D320497
MTLDKHKIEGVSQITTKTLPAEEFDRMLIEAGYDKIGSAPAQGNRLKIWWTHPTYPRVEAIYSPDGAVAITAYHVTI